MAYKLPTIRAVKEKVGGLYETIGISTSVLVP